MTAKQIVDGLRCAATYHGDPVCDGCPYLGTETVPDSLRGLTKNDTWDSCDVDRIALDAADLIEELVARIKELEAEKALEAQKGNTKVKAGCALPKERWREAAENLQMAGNFVAAFFREKNFDGRGEQDAQDWLADASLACVALLYVAEFATDKCRIVPLPEAPGGGTKWLTGT